MFLLGALLPTGFLSRLFLWLLKRRDGGVLKLLVANLASLAVAAVIGGFGLADGGPFAGTRALALYALPQAVWLLIDLVMYWRRNKPPILG